MAERVVFAQRHRKEEETVTQFINALRALAGNCDFGASLAERLRDQLVIGLNNDVWQKEIFRLHPTNESTLAQIEATIIHCTGTSVGATTAYTVYRQRALVQIHLFIVFL